MMKNLYPLFPANGNRVCKIFLAALVLLARLNASSQTTTRFNDGYLTLFKITSPATLTNTGTAVVTEEYLPATAAQSSPNYALALPAGAGGIVVSGSASSAGAMTRSENGRYLILPGYAAAVGDANSTFTTNGTARTLNGSGSFGAGITGSFFTAANDLRGATSDDGTNYWFSGGSIGVRYSNNGSTVTTVSTTSTGTRVINIFNGQLFFSTGAGTNGIYQVATGKPVTTGQTSTLRAPATAPYSFSVSPDGLTIYSFGSANSIVRFTYSGTYNAATFTYSGGAWSAASTGFALTGATGVAVDWLNYTFSNGANGARIYACNATTLVAGNDNGTAAITTTTLRTISGNNAFRGLAFSPVKQTVSLGANSPAAGSLTPGTANAVLFQFNLSADEGNSTLKKLILNQGGTATIGAGNSISNFRLIYDADGNGLASAAEISASLATGTVAGSAVSFSGITQTYITEGSSNNYLVIADIAAAGSGTFVPSIASNYTINGTTFTTNLFNAGGSPVNIGTTAPAGNTLTIGGGTPAPVINSAATAASVFGTTGVYAITATNSPISYNATSLPAGATFSGNQITVGPNTAVGVYSITISATNAGGTGTATLTYTVTAAPVTQANFTGVIVPQFMSGDATSRLPMMFRATVSGLSAATTYRYITQAVLATDFGTSANSGVGNPVLVSSNGTTYTYTTAPDVTSAGNYETFTTDAAGSYTGWFGLVNSGNLRFTTPGNTIYPIIRVADNAAGVTQAAYALDLGIRVLNFTATAGPNNGSFLNSTSGATPKNLAAIYDNVAGTGRPLFIAPIEAAGITIANVASGYLTANGSWNAVIPNDNANGVRRIAQLSVTTGNIVGCAATDADGIWPTGNVNTVNPTNGTAAITIATADAPLNTCVNAATSTVSAQSTATYSYTSNIAYINYQAASGLTLANSVGVGGFTINDIAPNDGLATTLTAITFTVPAATGAIVRTAALFDGSTNIAELTGVSGTSISFSGLNLVAPSGAAKNFELRVTFQNTVTDKYQMSFTVSAVTAAGGGSSFAAADGGGAATSTVGDFNRIDVVATRLVFTQGPTNTPVLTNMTPVVTVAANDGVGFNNTDLDFVSPVTLMITTTTCGALTGNTVTAVNGIASFPSLQGTVAENGLTITATTAALPAATSAGSFAFTASAAMNSNLVTWNFADQNTTADAGTAANISNTISVAGGVNTISYPTGAGGTGDYAISGTSSWASGSGTKYWLINVATTGYQNLTLGSKQVSSNTGPRDFKIQYSIGSSGAWTDISGGSVTTANDAFVSGVVANLALPAACENQPLVYIRWIMTSNIAVTGGAVASGGTSRIDDIVINGVSSSPAAGLYYQSKTSGIFETACTWEASTSPGGPWSQAPVPPDFSARAINILNGNTVTITANETLDELTVNNGGALILGDFTLLLNNGSGTDLTVNGSFTDNASSANGTSFSSGATWALGTAGTFVKTRNSSAAVYRDNYEGGMSGIPATANWIIRYTGASDVSFTTINSFYPNLSFENASATATYTFISKFTGNSSIATVKGNLDIGGTTYTNGVVVGNENTFAALPVLGDIIVRAGSTLSNAGTPSGTGFNLKGNLTVAGIFAVNNNAAGLTSFSGTSDQTISGGGIFTPQNLTLSNTGGASVVVNAGFGIPGTLTFANNSALKFGTGDISIKSTATATGIIAAVPASATISYTGSGRFIAERYIATPRKWQFISPDATTDATALSFQNSWMEAQAVGSGASTGYGMWITGAGGAPNFDAATSTPTIKWWNGSSYTGITAVTDNIHAYSAYFAYVRGDRGSTGTNGISSPTVLRTRGKIHTGNYPSAYINIPAYNDITAIGNPYASPVDLRQLYMDAPAGTAISIFVWDPKLTGSQGLGGFQTLTGSPYSTFTISPGGGSYPGLNAGDPMNTIESGQAFYIQGAVSPNNIQFTEAAKTTEAHEVFFAPGHPEMLSGLLSVRSTDNLVTVDGFRDYFGSSYNGAADLSDAHKLPNTNENISIKTGGQLLSVEFRNPLAETDTIQINMANMRIKDYQWNVRMSNLDEPGLNGFLVDRFLNSSTALDLNGAATYDFSVTADAGSYAADRFIIVFARNSAGPLPVHFTAVAAKRNDDKTATVSWHVENEIAMQDYRVERSNDGTSFIAIGAKPAASNNGGGAAYIFADVTASRGNNYYRIRGNSINGQIQYSSIVKVGPLNEIAAISIYPNPVSGNRLSLYFNSQAPGEYTVRIFNSAGEQVETAAVHVDNDHTVNTLPLQHATAAGLYRAVITDPAGKNTSLPFILN